MSEMGSTTRYVSGNTIKIMLDGNNVPLRPDLEQSIVARFGFDPQKVPATFPYNKYLEIVSYLGPILYPGKSPTQADDELGYHATTSYLNSPIGQILKGTAGVMGPRRAFDQFLRVIKNSLPWATHELEDVSPNHLRYYVRTSGERPALMRGVIRASVEAMGIKLMRLETIILSPDAYLHEIEWL